jgi:phospholipid transport system substrate-binding protein
MTMTRISSRRTLLALAATLIGAVLVQGSVAQAAADASGVDASTPSTLVETVARTILTEIDAHRADYRKDSGKLDKLVSSVLLPHFDSDYAAMLVLGKHWSSATPEQRQRFTDGFYHSLLHNYGTELVEFSLDRLQVLPYRGDAAATAASVHTLVRRSSGTQVNVTYSLRKTDQGWKAYDVTIEGISYVKSFRDDFGAEIDQKGLDAVIARLEKDFSITPTKG